MCNYTVWNKGMNDILQFGKQANYLNNEPFVYDDDTNCNTLSISRLSFLSFHWIYNEYKQFNFASIFQHEQQFKDCFYSLQGIPRIEVIYNACKAFFEIKSIDFFSKQFLEGKVKVKVQQYDEHEYIKMIFNNSSITYCY